MIVTYKDDVATLDPAIGYDWQNWSMIKSLFDGLMDYEPGTTDAQARPRRELRRSRADGTVFTFKLRHGREIPQRPRDDRRRREVFDRARRQPGDAEPGRRLLRARSRASTSCRRQRPTSLSGVTVVDPLDRRVRRCRGPTPPSCMSWRSTSRIVVPKEEVDEVRRRLRQAPGRHRRLQARRMDARPAPRLRAQPRLLAARACRISTRSPSRSARSRSWRCCACSRARSTSSATAFRRRKFLEVKDDPEQKARDRRGRPAAHRLRHDERQRCRPSTT